MTGIISRLWNRTPKVVEVPTDDRQQLEGLETWCVVWMARSGIWPDRPDLCTCTSVAQAFTNEVDAKEFEKALRDAYALVRDTLTPRSIKCFKM